jgi:hypothetical protein
MLTAKLTSDQYVQLGQELQDETSLAMTGDSGELRKDGIAVQYVYDQTAETLTLTVTHRPFLVTVPMAESRLRQALQQHGIVVTQGGEPGVSDRE